MRIAVFGKTGQVATELGRLGADRLIGRDEADFADPTAVARVAETIEADAVINAAAYTAVDKAEEEEALATVVNGASVGALGQVCAARGIPLVHISTDYVFDGAGETPWTPDDPVGPIGAYGRSKLAGEQALADAGGIHGIMRTSWVFSAHGGNFVKTMLRLGADRDALTIVADQIGGPTAAADIAAGCLAMARGLAGDGSKTGIYHFAGGPDVSWADFARAIFERSGLSVDVTDIPTEAYPTPAARPKNSRMDCGAFERAFGMARPSWEAALDKVLTELSA